MISVIIFSKKYWTEKPPEIKHYEEIRDQLTLPPEEPKPETVVQNNHQGSSYNVSYQDSQLLLIENITDIIVPMITIGVALSILSVFLNGFTRSR